MLSWICDSTKYQPERRKVPNLGIDVRQENGQPASEGQVKPLTRAEQERIAQALLSPPPPTDALARAFDRLRQLLAS